MPLTICVYEDGKFSQFHPLTFLRPIYLLRAGIVPLFQRLRRHFSNVSVTLLSRDSISPLVAEKMSDYPLNIIKKPESGDLLFLNGRIRNYGDLPKFVKESRLSTIYKNRGETVGMLFQEDFLRRAPAIGTTADYLALFGQETSTIPDFDTSATLYQYCYQIIEDIEKEVTEDFKRLNLSISPETTAAHPGAHLIDSDNIFLDTGVQVCPGAVLDASKGPIFIGANTRIESQAAIYGPCFIAANCTVMAGKISRSSIGHSCRVGGEVENSVFHAYVNKYHSGFIGHSYAGAWVNFGAMTTNSDLKNNYSNIRIMVDGNAVDTGSIKVGAFIGDHTKFGIGTMLNTGINIGVCCNLFGGSLILDKEVAPFQWGQTGNYETYHFDKAIETAQRTSERRNAPISEREIMRLRSINEKDESDIGILDW